MTLYRSKDDFLRIRPAVETKRESEFNGDCARLGTGKQIASCNSRGIVSDTHELMADAQNWRIGHQLERRKPVNRKQPRRLAHWHSLAQFVSETEHLRCTAARMDRGWQS